MVGFVVIGNSVYGELWEISGKEDINLGVLFCGLRMEKGARVRFRIV